MSTGRQEPVRGSRQALEIHESGQQIVYRFGAGAGARGGGGGGRASGGEGETEAEAAEDLLWLAESIQRSQIKWGPLEKLVAKLACIRSDNSETPHRPHT